MLSHSLVNHPGLSIEELLVKESDFGCVGDIQFCSSRNQCINQLLLFLNFVCTWNFHRFDFGFQVGSRLNQFLVLLALFGNQGACWLSEDAELLLEIDSTSLWLGKSFFCLSQFVLEVVKDGKFLLNSCECVFVVICFGLQSFVEHFIFGLFVYHCGCEHATHVDLLLGLGLLRTATFGSFGALHARWLVWRSGSLHLI